MSILSQKLYIKKGSSTAACNIYSTAAEAGDKALRVGNGYVALKDVTDANATAGRVSIGGATYAIATKHESGGGTAVPYTEKSWTEAGSHSFTVPAGITRIRVALCGGGAGQGAFAAGNTGAIHERLICSRQAARAARRGRMVTVALLTAMRQVATE